jgi:hypothetical protein
MKVLPYILLFELLFFGGLLGAQTDSSAYSFFIAGHTSGKFGENNVGLYPVFKEKFGYIRSRQEIKFGVLLGDMVSPHPTANDWDEVDADIDSLSLPVYIAVGNHDMESRPLFESRYGITYYSFIHQNDLFIILDPNIDSCNISSDQLAFLKNIVEENAQTVDNIFVMFHQLLWWEYDNKYADIKPNSSDGMADSINFWTEIEPLFRQLPNKVVFCAGDLGAAPWSSDFMYDTYDNISFVATGMGEGVGDNFIIINVDSGKAITYDLICLNDSNINCFGELTDYNISLAATHDLEKRGLNIYPNPINTSFTIAFKKNMNVTAAVFNLSGQLIMEKEFSEKMKYSIDASHWPKGMYIIQLANGRDAVIRKLIVY